MDATEIFVVIAVALFASIAQGLAGFGFVVIAVPFFLLILNVEDAVVVATLLTIANVALMATRLRGAVCWLPVGRLVVGSLAGMPVGILVLLFAPEDALRIIVGVSAIAMATWLASGPEVQAAGARSDLLVGAVSGVLRTSTGMSGPPVVVYLQGQRYAARQFRASLAVFLLVTSVISVGAFAGAGVVSAEALSLAAIGLPAVFAGNWASDRLVQRVEGEFFRRLVLLLLVAPALWAVGFSITRLVD